VELDALPQVNRPYFVRVVGDELFGQLRHRLQVFVEVGEAFPHARAAVEKTAAVRAVVKVPPDTDYQFLSFCAAAGEQTGQDKKN
jgi:hypothetical protein